MAAQQVANSSLRYLFREVKKFHLRPVKKLSFQFDPFHENAKCVRDFSFYISSRKIRKTSEACVFKTDVVNDRSEPLINIDLHNGKQVLFKCGNLTVLEVAREYNSIVEKYDIIEEEPALKLQGALKKKSLKK